MNRYVRVACMVLLMPAAVALAQSKAVPTPGSHTTGAKASTTQTTQPVAQLGSPEAPLHFPASSKTVVWGNYWWQNKPAFHIHSGQTVAVDTVTVSNPTSEGRAGVPEDKIEPDLKEIYANFPQELRVPGTHILTGPIYVDEAEPGDTLVVHIVKIEGRSDFATNGFGTGFLGPYMAGMRQSKLIALDWKTMTAHFGPGIEIPMHPFFGSIGVAPPVEKGKVSSVPPDAWAGNMDNKDLVAGTTLLLPVFVPGALLEMGDGHAGQGDGEIDGNAMETSLRGTLRMEVIKRTGQTYPRAETPTQYISMGFDADLTKAATIAGEQMIDFLVNQKGMTRADAYQLCSVAADFHISELVDRNVGVHVLIKKELFVGGSK